MRKHRGCRRALSMVGAVATVGLLAGPLPAMAQDQPKKFLSIGILGDIQQNKTPNQGKMHLSGSAGFATADYTRGAFDDVPEDLDEISATAGAAVIIELPNGQGDWLRDLTLTVGTSQGWADQVQPTDSEVSDWYDSNFYTGLAAEIDGGWRAGLTYTAFTSPNDVSPTSQEMTVAAGYAASNFLGSLSPQVKVTKPIDGDDGLYTEVGVAPQHKFFQNGTYPLTLTVPVRLGVGFDDFYGDDSDTTGYVGVGVTGSVPLAFMPNDYGNWTLKAGLDVLIREHDLATASGEFDDGGPIVPIGTVGVSFTY